MTPYIGYGLGSASAACAVVAAYYAYRASTVKVEPAWDLDPGDPDLKPKNFEQHAFGMVNALDRAAWRTGGYSKRAACWAIAAAVFGLAVATLAWTA